MKAIRYLRFSADGQSAHSIERQDLVTGAWLQHNGIELVDTFTDEGYSARTFDRPDLKALMAFIRKNRSINYLVVSELTRFSREAGDAINMVKSIQQQYGIRIVSAGRSTIYDCSDSNSFFMMGLEFLLGNSENIKRQNDINGGIYTAKAEKGRWIYGYALYGYRKEGRGPASKLVPNDAEAVIVKQIFAWWLQGLSVTVIRKQAKEMGFTKTGSDAVTSILKQPVYMGYQYVKPFKNLPGGLFPLKDFEPLVSEEVWQQAQDLFKPVRMRTQLDDAFPLRGVLKCRCGRSVTGAPSRGRHGGYFNYYKCQHSKHLNLSTRKAHQQLEQIFACLNLPERLVQAIRQQSRVLLQQRLQDAGKLLLQQRTAMANVQQQLESLEEKFIANQISAETYSRWHGTYHEQRRQLQVQVEQLQRQQHTTEQMLEANLEHLQQLDALWRMADTAQKQELVKRVFDNRLYWADGTYRTPYLLPFLLHNTLILKQQQLLELEGEQVGGGEVELTATQSNPLLDFVAFLSTIKVA